MWLATLGSWLNRPLKGTSTCDLHQLHSRVILLCCVMLNCVCHSFVFCRWESTAALLWQYSLLRFLRHTINQRALQLFGAQLTRVVSVNGIKPVAKAGLGRHWGSYTGIQDKGAEKTISVSQFGGRGGKTTPADEGGEEPSFSRLILSSRNPSRWLFVSSFERTPWQGRSEGNERGMKGGGTIVVPDRVRISFSCLIHSSAHMRGNHHDGQQ